MIRLLQECQDAYDSYEANCSGFLKGVCKELGVTTEEMFEIFSVANIVGGTIVIPHLRRAVEYWEALQ